MVFTRRFLWLVALGVVPLLLSALAPGLAYLGVLWNFLVAGLAFADYLLCPRPDAVLEAERVTDEALSVAAANTVALRVRNNRDRPLAALVRDEPPPEFAIDPNDSARRALLRLAPYETRTLEYEVTPPRRGDFRFGDVYARITGPLGLVVRQGAVPAAATISVYPNLHAVEEYELLLRRASLSRQGSRRVRTTGGGREFASLREYTPDDEYRTIDWKATARRAKVMSRTYEAERSQDILLLIDLGRLMRQEIAHTQKLDHVVNAALMLAHVAAEADDRVGLLTFANEVRQWLPPRRGRAQANEALHTLYAARAEPIESDYRAAFRFLSARWRKRSLAVLFTDLADAESSALLLAEIAQLASSHLVVCVVVRDPLIGERARQTPESATQVYEKAVAEEVLGDRRRALNLLKKRGVLVVDAEPRELSVDLVTRYLTVKSRAML
jgi:uncharacterized protein (DUF58 family)